MRLLTLLLVSPILIFSSCSQTQKIEYVDIVTRDSIKLATDLYFPSEKSEKYSVVLMRTPYDKSTLKDYGEFYASKGFVTAIQDVRGKYESEGEWVPYLHEGQDGYDVIEWLGNQDWSSGNVGMIGGSYLGSVQLAAAIQQPPSLKAIVPNITPATPYYNTPFENGAFALGWAIRWTDLTYQDLTPEETGEKFQDVFNRLWYYELSDLPVIELDKKIMGDSVVPYRIFLDSTFQYSLEIQDYFSQAYKIKIPVLIQSGWFDVANRGSKLLYKTLTDTGNKNVKLIMGPWPHTDRSMRQLGPTDLGPEAEIDLFEIYADWFEYWLNGDRNDIMNNPRIQLFNIGPNNWIYANDYPLQNSREINFYLAKDSSQGFGILSEMTPQMPDSSSTYEYDPGKPSPSFAAFLKKNLLPEYLENVELRSDILVFETAPLEDTLTIMGPVSTTFFASSSAVDTDFNVTLMGKSGEGQIYPIGQTLGVVRAKYRNGMKQEDFLKPDEVYEFNVDLSHTGYTLYPGEVLRLELASAAFPEFSRNLNTGANNHLTTEYQVARQTIFHSKEYPSRVTLTVMKE